MCELGTGVRSPIVEQHNRSDRALAAEEPRGSLYPPGQDDLISTTWTNLSRCEEVGRMGGLSGEAEQSLPLWQVSTDEVYGSWGRTILTFFRDHCL